VRVELYDWNAQAYVITSQNAALIGDWFAEQAGNLMTADSRLQVQIRIWPQSEAEAKTIGVQGLTEKLTQDGLLHLADVILKAAAKLADMESADAGAR